MGSLFDLSRLHRVAGVLWGLVLLTLPVSTFRYIPSAYGATQIKPLALYPLAMLFPILLFIIIRERKLTLPGGWVPLLAFLLVAIAATLIGATYAPEELRGQTYWGRALRAWVSLAAGLVFFFSAFWTHRSRSDMERSLKWLYAGLALSIAWGFVQILAIHTPFIDAEAIGQVQGSFSERGLHPSRISGFAFEPSWLADQVVILYFPWLVAGLLSGYRLTRFKWLEPSLAGLSVILLLFTFSRSGYLNGLLVIGLVVLTTGRGRLRRLWSWFISPFRRENPPHATTPSYSRAMRIGVVVVVVLALAGAAFAVSENRYLTTTFTFDPEKGLFDYVNEISGGPRLAYAMAGYGAYVDHVWTGVGMGAAGFYIYDNFPDFALTTSAEIARRFSPNSDIVQNTKNFYVRLLAETGIAGLWLFLAFYLSMLGSVRSFFRRSAPFLRFLGIAGLFTWLAAAFRNLLQDSFAFPLMWVGLGMVLSLVHTIERTAER